MNIEIDGKVVLSLSDLQVKIMQHSVPKEIFMQDLSRRIEWLLIDRYVHPRCLDIMAEWQPILIHRGMKSFPSDPQEFAKLVFDQLDYKDASAKAAETKAQQEAYAEIQ